VISQSIILSQVFKNTNVFLFLRVFRNVVDMESEKLVAITSLVIGAVLLILAGYSLGSVPHNYTWTMIALSLGLVFVILALGTLLPEHTKKPENRKSITLLFVGLVLTGVGVNLLIFTPGLIIIFRFNWWIFTLTGAVLLIIGIFLFYHSRVYRTSLDG
jgi:peptidoglycan/LPS O-acetylase OafA/YrhL